MAGGGDFDRAAFGSGGVPALEIGLMALSFAATNIQLGLLLHAGVVERLRSRHQSRLLGRPVKD